MPGAFERIKHRAAGRSVTLDEIEKTILPEFKEPRLYLALGRGAIGSGRLKSEAYTGERLAQQLDAIQQEFVAERPMVRVDRAEGQISVTPIVSWHDGEFVAAYDKEPGGRYAQRSPIERAIIAFIGPKLLPLEKEFVEKNEFKVTYHPFDWRLNDLTGGRRRIDGSAAHRQNCHRDRIQPRAGAGQRASLVAEGCRVCICARGSEQLAAAAVEVEASARRPNMIMAVQADVSTADGISARGRADGREIRRPRHPRQQRRSRRRARTCSTPPTRNGRRRSTKRCFPRFAPRAWRCRT